MEDDLFPFKEVFSRFYLSFQGCMQYGEATIIGHRILMVVVGSGPYQAGTTVQADTWAS